MLSEPPIDKGGEPIGGRQGQPGRLSCGDVVLGSDVLPVVPGRRVQMYPSTRQRHRAIAGDPRDRSPASWRRRSASRRCRVAGVRRARRRRRSSASTGRAGRPARDRGVSESTVECEPEDGRRHRLDDPRAPGADVVAAVAARRSERGDRPVRSRRRGRLGDGDGVAGSRRGCPMTPSMTAHGRDRGPGARRRGRAELRRASRAVVAVNCRSQYAGSPVAAGVGRRGCASRRDACHVSERRDGRTQLAPRERRRGRAARAVSAAIVQPSTLAIGASGRTLASDPAASVARAATADRASDDGWRRSSRAAGRVAELDRREHRRRVGDTSFYAITSRSDASAASRRRARRRATARGRRRCVGTALSAARRTCVTERGRTDRPTASGRDESPPQRPSVDRGRERAGRRRAEPTCAALRRDRSRGRLPSVRPSTACAASPAARRAVGDAGCGAWAAAVVLPTTERRPRVRDRRTVDGAGRCRPSADGMRVGGAPHRRSRPSLEAVRRGPSPPGGARRASATELTADRARRRRGTWPRCTVPPIAWTRGPTSSRRHDPGHARLVPVQGRARPGDLRRQGQEPALSGCRTTSRTRRNMHPRTAQMVATAETVEWIQVRNDVEALMLEYNLIKEHRPRFNVRLRDDKSYPFLAVTVVRRVAPADGDAGPQAQGRPVLRALRQRLRHPRDARPAAADVPAAHLLGQQVRAPRAARPAVPAVPHREVLGTLRRRGRPRDLPADDQGAARLPRRRDRRRGRPHGSRHERGRRRARVREGGPGP